MHMLTIPDLKKKKKSISGEQNRQTSERASERASERERERERARERERVS